MFCSQCGRENADGVKFCPGCGAPMDLPEAQEGQDTPVYEAEKPVADAPFVSANEQSGSADVSLGTAAAGKRGLRSLAVIAAIAVAAIVVVIGLIKLAPLVFGGGRSEAFLYTTGDGELMFRKNTAVKTKSTELNDNDVYSAAFSEDGKYIYFVEASGKLYKISFSAADKKDPEPEKIDSGVDYIYTSVKGGVIYGKDGGEIYFYNGKGKNKIAKEHHNYSTSADKKYFYYTTYDADSDSDRFSLFRVDLRKNGEKETLIKGASGIISSYDADVLVFSKSNGDDTYDLYRQKPGGDKEKIASDVRYPLRAEVKDGKVKVVYLEGDDYDDITLKLYDNGSTKKIADEINFGYIFDIEASIYIYQKGEDYDYQWYQNVGGVESELDWDDDYDPDGIHVLSSDEAVISVYDDGIYRLLSYSIGKNSLEFNRELGEAYSYPTIRDEKGGKALYYINDDNDSGDLIRYDGKTRTIAKGVSFAMVYETGITLTEEDHSDGIYTLSWADGSGEKKKISDDVSRYSIIGDKKVLFIKDGDLFVWNGSKRHKLASDVENIFTHGYAEYSYIYC